VIDPRVFYAADESVLEHDGVVVSKTIVVAHIVVFGRNIDPRQDVVGIARGGVGAGACEAPLYALVAERRADRQPGGHLAGGAPTVAVTAARQRPERVVGDHAAYAVRYQQRSA